MTARRRVDWDVLLDTQAPRPTIRANVDHPLTTNLVSAFSQLASLREQDEILRQSVEVARTLIGFQRVAFFLVDEESQSLVGTWGTDFEGHTIDEHHVMSGLSEDVIQAFRRAEQGTAFWGIIDNCPLSSHKREQSIVHGRGWVAYTPIVSSHRRIGMMFNDAGAQPNAFDPLSQAQGALLATFLGSLLERGKEGSPRIAKSLRSPSPLIAAVVESLAADPTLSGSDLAKEHGVSLSRLVRSFKSELGVTLVAHRNRLRLDRFFRLIRTEETNLLQAATEAGFGSYAQFHRVFRLQYGVSPRVLLKEQQVVPLSPNGVQASKSL